MAARWTTASKPARSSAAGRGCHRCVTRSPGCTDRSRTRRTSRCRGRRPRGPASRKQRHQHRPDVAAVPVTSTFMTVPLLRRPRRRSAPWWRTAPRRTGRRHSTPRSRIRPRKSSSSHQSRASLAGEVLVEQLDLQVGVLLGQADVVGRLPGVAVPLGDLVVQHQGVTPHRRGQSPQQSVVLVRIVDPRRQDEVRLRPRGRVILQACFTSSQRLGSRPSGKSRYVAFSTPANDGQRRPRLGDPVRRPRHHQAETVVASRRSEPQQRAAAPDLDVVRVRAEAHHAQRPARQVEAQHDASPQTRWAEGMQSGKTTQLTTIPCPLPPAPAGRNGVNWPKPFTHRIRPPRPSHGKNSLACDGAGSATAARGRSTTKRPGP